MGYKRAVLEAGRERSLFAILTVLEAVYTHYLSLTKSCEVGVIISDLQTRRVKREVRHLGSSRPEVNT